MAEHMMIVLMIFADTLQPERDPEMRMSFLILLDTMAFNPALHACLRTGQLQEGTTYIGGVLKYRLRDASMPTDIPALTETSIRFVREISVASPDQYAWPGADTWWCLT
jgi:hypothetical protein